MGWEVGWKIEKTHDFTVSGMAIVGPSSINYLAVANKPIELRHYRCLTGIQDISGPLLLLVVLHGPYCLCYDFKGSAKLSLEKQSS